MLQLACELHSPSSAVIALNINNPVHVRGQFYSTFIQGADSMPADGTNEVTEFKDDVLPSARVLCVWLGFRSSKIIGSEQDHREVYCRMPGKLLDYSFTTIGLFMEDYDIEAEALKEARDRLLQEVVVTMYQENSRACTR